ncbi:MAG: sulfur transferase domain-containing protein [bacterium]
MTPRIPNAMQPEDGVLTGGQPTRTDFEYARDAGYKTIINLRAHGEDRVAEQAKTLPEMGFRYIHFPIDGAADVTPDNARAFAAVLADAEKPVMIHCGSGNRVGALAAMKAFHVDRKPAPEALVIGRAWGLTALEPVVRDRLK